MDSHLKKNANQLRVYYDCESADSGSDSADELDIMAIRERGRRSSTRNKKQRQVFGFQIQTDQIELSGDDNIE